MKHRKKTRPVPAAQRTQVGAKSQKQAAVRRILEGLLLAYSVVSALIQIYQWSRGSLSVDLVSASVLDRQLSSDLVLTNNGLLMPARSILFAVCPSSHLGLSGLDLFGGTKRAFDDLRAGEHENIPLVEALQIKRNSPVDYADVRVVIRYKQALRTFYVQKHLIAQYDGTPNLKFFERHDEPDRDAQCGL